MLLHLVLGVAMTAVPLVGSIWFIAVALYFLVKVLLSKDPVEYYIFGIIYISFYELYLRASNSGLPYETGKLYAIGLSIIFIRFSKYKFNVKDFNLMLFLLLPSCIYLFSIDFLSARKAFTFNLGGMLSFIAAGIAFHRVKLTPDRLKVVLNATITSLILLLVLFIIKAPKLDEISFSGESNDAFTGGFGPNQIATTFGLGAMVCALTAWRGVYFVSRPVSIAIIIAFLGEAALSFSRGGVLSFTLGALSGIVIDFYFNRTSKRAYISLALGVVVAIMGYFAYLAVDDFTGNRLSARYEETIQTTDLGDETETTFDFTGRDIIIASDLEVFTRNFVLGVGPGGTRYNRDDLTVLHIGEIAAHTEYTRLLSEHGLFGITFLIVLFISTFRNYKRKSISGKMFAVAFSVFCLFTMAHAATRLSAPLIFFAMAFALYEDAPKRHPLKRLPASG